MNNRTLRITIGIVLVMIMSLTVILPTTSYALFPRYYPVVRTVPGSGGGGSSGVGNGGGSYSGYHGPIWQPQMHYAPGSGGGGSTSTFSTPSSNGNGQPQAVVTDYSNGVVTQSTPYGTVGHGGVHVPVTSATSQSTTSTTSGQSTSTQEVITITKTYTQYIYDTYEVNHYIYYYLYPIIKWVFTLVNIGQYQQPGYHMVGSEKLFTPGSGSGGIFVPVFAQEAVYAYNIAPSTKPQITGWHTGSTSQSSSGPFLVSQSSTPPQLSSIQDTVNNAGQAVNNIQQSATNPNGLASTTYVYYSNTNTIIQPGQNNTIIWTQKPYYYSNPNQNFGLAWQSLTQGNIAGAAYYTGKGIYENLWNGFAWTTQQLYNIVTQASNAWNTATLIKSVAYGIATVVNGVEGALNSLTHVWTQSWQGW